VLAKEILFLGEFSVEKNHRFLPFLEFLEFKKSCCKFTLQWQNIVAKNIAIETKRKKRVNKVCPRSKKCPKSWNTEIESQRSPISLNTE